MNSQGGNEIQLGFAFSSHEPNEIRLKIAFSFFPTVKRFFKD